MTKYLLIPHYSKSLTETVCWTRTLTTGKTVTLKVFNVYRCFKIEIELDDPQKCEMLKMDTIPLDNYSFVPDEMEGCECWSEIMDETEFTQEEIEEIDHDNIDIDFMDDDDMWKSDHETRYELWCGCDLLECAKA
jgi:hypothetical protein